MGAVSKLVLVSYLTSDVLGNTLVRFHSHLGKSRCCERNFQETYTYRMMEVLAAGRARSKVHHIVSCAADDSQVSMYAIYGIGI